MKLFTRGSAVAVLLVLAGWFGARAADVTLAWDANTDADLGGYRLFQSGHSLLGLTPAQALTDAGTTSLIINDKTATQTTVSGLADGGTTYFRLTALDTAGNQSDFNLDASGNPAEVVVANSALAPQKFLSPVPADGINDSAVFGIGAQEVTVFDTQGRKIFHAASGDSGGPIIRWTCRDEGGTLVPGGAYIAKIKQVGGSTVYQSFVVVK